MNDQPLHNVRQRTVFVAVILSLVAAVLVAQLVRWMLWPPPVDAGANLFWLPKTDPAALRVPRGNILDRDGALLVTTGFDWKISATPKQLSRSAAELAPRIAPLVGMSEADFIARIESPADWNGSDEWVPLQRVDFQTGQEISRRKKSAWDFAHKDPVENPDYGLAWDAVNMEPAAIRLYPEGTLAAHTLGFVNYEPLAYYGIEKFYDEELRAQGVFDVTSGGVPVSEMGGRFAQNASPDGAHDLILTIDRAIQYLVEQELRETVQRFGATEGTIMVMEPKTGGILASASYPTYSPAHYDASPQSVWIDPAVSVQYEPGSIFKIVTMAAGLNAGVVTPDSTYVDRGCVYVAGERLCNLDGKLYGTSTMRDVLLHSLNTGTIHVSGLLGKEFYTYLERFGFGAKTQIDLSEEIACVIRNPNDAGWSELDLATNSFGQGLAVTPVQMIAAVSAVANDGLLMKPHVVDGIIANGRVLKIEPRSVRQAIRKDTAETLTQMLTYAVDQGAELARVPGYSVAGKSGTAQIPDEDEYDASDTIAGFVGFLPAEDPAFVILVKIVKPRGETMGNKVAAPAFKNIAQQLVVMAGIAPDRQVDER